MRLSRKGRHALVLARKLLSDPKKWIKGAYARSAANHVIRPTSKKAVCFCLSGAILRYTKDDDLAYDHAERAVKHVLTRTFASTRSLAGFNDADSTQHADVLRVLDRAIASYDE